MPQHSAPGVRIAHPPELGARDARDPVVTREALVQEGVVRREQFEQAPVLSNQVIEEELRLPDQVLAKLAREVRIEVGLGLVVLRVLEPQPLRGEARRERLRAGVRQHPAHLRLEDRRIREPSLRGQCQQFVIRARRPEEEREARREVHVRDRIALTRRDLGRRLLETEDEGGVGEDCLQRGPNPDLEAVLRRGVSVCLIVEGHGPGEILLRHRPPVRLAREPRHDRRRADPSPLARRRGCPRNERPRNGLAPLRMAVEDPTPARRLGEARGAPRTRDHQFAQVGERRDPVVRPRLGVLASDEGPAGRLQAVLVRPLDRAHERRRDLALPRPNEDGFRPDRRRRAPAVLEAEECDPFPVNRDVDVLETGPLPEERLDRDHVLPIRREVVGHDHPAARPVRRALDVIPGVLRHVDRVRVLGRLRGGGRVADGDPAHLRGGPQVRLEEGGREALCVGHVVEGAEVGVRREPAAGVDLETQEIPDHALVLGPVQPLEAPRAGIPVTGGVAVDHHLQCLDEREQCVRGGPALAGRRHHPRAELPDHLLRGRRPLVRHIDLEPLQDEVPAQQSVIVAAGAVALDDSGQIRRVDEGGQVVIGKGRGGRRAGRTIPRGLPHEGEPQPQSRTRTQCLHAPVLRERRMTLPRNLSRNLST